MKQAPVSLSTTTPEPVISVTSSTRSHLSHDNIMPSSRRNYITTNDAKFLRHHTKSIFHIDCVPIRGLHLVCTSAIVHWYRLRLVCTSARIIPHKPWLGCTSARFFRTNRGWSERAQAPLYIDRVWLAGSVSHAQKFLSTLPRNSDQSAG